MLSRIFNFYSADDLRKDITAALSSKTGAFSKLPISACNQYKIIRSVGFGAFGEVFMAKNKDQSKDHAEFFAIKKFSFHAYKGGNLKLSSLRELGIIYKLDHPNIVQFFEICFTNSILLYLCCREQKISFVMELCSCNVRYLTDRYELLRDGHRKSVMRQLLTGLAFMHRHGVIHRDIKPENLLISKDGTVKIGDFGMARIIRQDPTQNYSLCVGTYGYRAPELLHRHAPYDEKVDVWAAGCVMSELYDGSFIMSPHYSLFISENGRYSD
ncbi:unnamed protein product, partial [Hymenolepis diminuta]